MGLGMGMNGWEWERMGMLQVIPTHLQFTLTSAKLYHAVPFSEGLFL